MKNKQRKELGLVNIDTAGLVKPILIVIGIGIVGWGVYSVRKKNAYSQKKKIYNKSTESGTAENIAVRLRNAMGDFSYGIDWDGTDNKQIFEIFSVDIKTKKDYEAVQKAYKKLTQKELIDDLNNELKPSEVQKLLDIIAPKAESISKPETATDNSKKYAQDLKEAVYIDNWGKKTDVPKIFDTFDKIPNQSIFLKTKKEYTIITGKDLWEDLQNEWGLGFTPFWSSMYELDDGTGRTLLEILKSKSQNKFGGL